VLYSRRLAGRTPAHGHSINLILDSLGVATKPLSGVKKGKYQTAGEIIGNTNS
jgi:hypothetical protein